MKEPGIYFGIREEEYATWPALRSSTLSAMADGKTPAHLKEAREHPTAQTPALRFGSAFHELVLEPDIFDKRWCIGLGIDRRSKANQAKWADFEASNAGKGVLTQADYDKLQRMRDGCFANPLARTLLAELDGQNEVAGLWDEPTEHGPVRAKLKLDRIVEYQGLLTLIDLKSAADASYEGFRRAVSNYGYYRQADWYRRGLSALYGEVHRAFVFVVVEKAAPYCTAIYELDADSERRAKIEVDSLLETYAECMATGAWPGYPGLIDMLELPPWTWGPRAQNPDMEVPF